MPSKLESLLFPYAEMFAHISENLEGLSGAEGEDEVSALYTYLAALTGAVEDPDVPNLEDVLRKLSDLSYDDLLARSEKEDKFL